MKTTLSVLLLGLLSLPTFAAETLQTDAGGSWRDELSFNTELGFSSRDVTDGLAGTENPIFTPSFGLTFMNATANVGASMNFNETESQGEFDEVSFGLSYEWAWNALTVTPSYTHYTYPNSPGSKNTGEVGLELSYAFWDGMIDAHTSHVLDVKELKRSYVGSFGMGASHDYNDRWSIGASLDTYVTSPKYNEASGFRKEWALQAVSIGIESTFKLTPNIYARPNMMFSSLLGGIRTDAKTASIDRDVFSGGLALGADF